MSVSELAAKFLKQGIPDQYAKLLASLDTAISQGMENRLNNVVLNVTGGQPKSFMDFVEENKAAWC